MIRFTDQAIQALVRSDAAARRFNPDARVRLVADPVRGVRAELVDAREPGDRVQQIPEGPQVYVEASLRGSVDAGDHDTLVLIQEHEIGHAGGGSPAR